MKKKTLIALLSMFCVSITLINAQENLRFTFQNGQITNDGSNTFYEVDVMVQTNNGQADLKLGSGQTYFNYNTAAFGPNVYANNRVIFEYEGTLIGQNIDAAAAPLYGTRVVNDNTSSRVSLAFRQTFAASTIADNNVTAIPVKLVHVKFQFLNVNEDPNVTFENDESVLSQVNDQYFTACGSAGNGPFDTADCTNYNGIQFFDVIYDNTNPTLGINEEDVTAEFSIYPNPISTTNQQLHIQWKHSSQDAKLRLYDISGRLIQVKNIVLNSGENTLHLPSLNSGSYLLNITLESTRKTMTKQLIIK